MDFFVTVIVPLLLGTLAISLLGVVRRYTFKKTAISPLQFLYLAYGSAAVIFAAGYVATWGFELPVVLSGFWTAVAGGTVTNFLIQYFNAKAASLDKGEVSLTAPLQAMTPGLITGLAIILGEYPGKLGLAGIFLMMVGSYVLLWPSTPKRWYEYFGPLSRLLLFLKWRRLPEAEKNKAKVVALALGSATMGTFGLLFDGLYVRRGQGMQGIVLASMVLVGGLAINYAAWYAIRPDSKKTEKQDSRSVVISKNLWKYLLAFAVIWVLHVILIQPTFDKTFVAYTGTLKRLSIIWSVLLGFWLFKEEEFKKRLWAALLIVGGAILISLDGVVGNVTDKIQVLGGF